MTKQETLMNNKRQDVFESLNKKKTYEPVVITGIKEIKGDNITITTQSEHHVIQAPDIQYDQSDAELGQTALTVGGVVGGMFAAKPTIKVVEQPAPVVVEQPAPIVVQ